jgi:hypothetical protein
MLAVAAGDVAAMFVVAAGDIAVTTRDVRGKR